MKAIYFGGLSPVRSSIYQYEQTWGLPELRNTRRAIKSSAGELQTRDELQALDGGPTRTFRAVEARLKLDTAPHPQPPKKVPQVHLGDATQKRQYLASRTSCIARSESVCDICKAKTSWKECGFTTCHAIMQLIVGCYCQVRAASWMPQTLKELIWNFRLHARKQLFCFPISSVRCMISDAWSL